MLLFAPENIGWQTFDDTNFLTDQQAPGIDGTVDEYLSEIGPEFHFADQFMWLDGIGEDNIV